MRSLREVTRFEVHSKGKYVGRVVDVLFHPTGRRVVGFVVQRPRIAYIIDRRDRFLALDSVSFKGSTIQIPSPREAWDRVAEKRVGVPWSDTVIWVGMPVVTKSGQRLGMVRDGLFSEKTGELGALGLSQGLAADATVGVRDLDAALLIGFDGEAVVVDDAAAGVEVDGGAAAAAGKGAAIAKQRVGEAAEVAGAAAKKAAAYGSATVRVVAKSETAKKAAGWLKAIKDEVVDAMGDPDDEK